MVLQITSSISHHPVFVKSCKISIQIDIRQPTTIDMNNKRHVGELIEDVNPPISIPNGTNNITLFIFS